MICLNPNIKINFLKLHYVIEYQYLKIGSIKVNVHIEKTSINKAYSTQTRLFNLFYL